MFNLFSHDQVDRRLRIRLAIFLVIALVIFGFIIKDVADGDVSAWLALLAIVVGAIVGTMLGRLLTIKWHEGKEKAVSEMDVAGGVGIVLYIVLEMSRNWLLGHWVSGVALSTLSLAFLGGALLGRYIGIGISVKHVLDKNA